MNKSRANGSQEMQATIQFRIVSQFAIQKYED